jgi:hypothetical protein
VPLEVLDEALVADREQPPVQRLARQSWLFSLLPFTVELLHSAVRRARTST